MPDGEGLIFFRQDDGLFRRAADASSPEQLLLPQPEQFVRTIPTAVNSAGTELLFVGITSLDADGDYGIYRLPLTGNAEPEVVLDEPGFRESTPKLSPDGRYMAYTTTETGAREIHIRPYPDVTSRRVVVSTGVASDPSWDAGGEYLYYLEQTLGGGNGPPGSLMRVAVQTDPVLELSEPEPVTSGVLFPNTSPNYAHDTDADRWLVYAGLPLQVSGSRAADLDEQLAIVVAENWVEWLKQEVPN
jgi:hypothetical protein